jgi:hypothetical protein
MVVLSTWGGIGRNSGRSIWRGLIVLSDPVGWLFGLGGVNLTLIGSFKRHHGREKTVKNKSAGDSQEPVLTPQSLLVNSDRA